MTDTVECVIAYSEIEDAEADRRCNGNVRTVL